MPCGNEPLRKPAWIACSIVFALGLALSLLLGTSGFPVPVGDDDFEKSPAAELVQNGRLAVPSARGFIPHAEKMFATYPPVYQLLLAAWYSVFGFSLFTTLAFCYSVHLINAVLICLIAFHFMNHVRDASIGSSIVAATVTGLIHVANLAYFDRPEEVALLWIWLEVILDGRVSNRPGLKRSIATGVLVGLAALTAPWVGVMGVGFVTIRGLLRMAFLPDRVTWFDVRNTVGGIFTSLTTAALMAGTWAVIMEFLQPGIMNEQFVFVLRYHQEHQLTGTLVEKLQLFWKSSVLFNPLQLAATGAILIFFPVFIFRSGWRKATADSIAIYVVSILGILAIAVIRPGAYTYLGSIQIFLLTLFGIAFCRFITPSIRHPATKLVWTAMLACLLFTYLNVIGLCYFVRNLPAGERPGAAFSRLQEIIPDDETVAVTYRHWYAFQGRNDWRNEFWCTRTNPKEILNCRWLVLFPGKEPPALIESFELVEEIPGSAPRNATYAYSIWRQRDPVSRPK